MRLALVGLGKMGGNMARRLIRGGHEVVGVDSSPQVVEQLAEEEGLIPSGSINEAVRMLESPQVVWVMVPSGPATETVLLSLADIVEPGAILIDGGNSNFNDSIRRGAVLKERGIHFIDAGVSGGVWGLSEGYSLMVGGEAEVVERVRPILETLAPSAESGWGRVGPVGSGHFVKMVHNGIEYGMMEAFAEGFELMRARQDFDLNPEQIAKIWQKGSVVRSWLLDLVALALEDDPNLTNIDDWVADSGEGRWTIQEAINLDVPLPAITLALFTRFRSRQDESYGAKLLAAMRNQFGGHAMRLLETK